MEREVDSKREEETLPGVECSSPSDQLHLMEGCDPSTAGALTFAAGGGTLTALPRRHVRWR